MIVDVDTSAAMKLLVDEAESAALAEHLEALGKSAKNTLVSSLLLHSELHCASNRRPEDLHPDAVVDVLSVLAVVDVENADLTTAPCFLAGSGPPTRSTLPRRCASTLVR